MELRALEQNQLADIWSIDRAEIVERIYRRSGEGLVLEPKLIDVKGWPPGEAEHYGPLLLDCVEHGGTACGAYDDGALIGAMVLESRFIGSRKDTLQLKFLHVSRRHRRTGVGRALFDRAVARARELGARRLYVSATESENTVDFYLRRGCRLAEEVDPALFALEPNDIHLALDISAEGGSR